MRRTAPVPPFSNSAFGGGIPLWEYPVTANKAGKYHSNGLNLNLNGCDAGIDARTHFSFSHNLEAFALMADLVAEQP